LPTDDAERKGRACAALRFLVTPCADLLPFARTRLTAQTTCSMAAAGTGLPTEASQGTMILPFSLHLKVDNSQTEILPTALGLRPGD
jgi:hypothetical protein